jgi:transglutaminase-like putative cysteine protease
VSRRYRLHQTFRYEYTTPTRDLRHRLMVVPPRLHGDQRRLEHRLAVDGAAVRTATRADGFGNHVVEVRADHVSQAIEFDAWVEVERDQRSAPALLSLPALGDPRYRRPTRLTTPSPDVIEAARELRRGDCPPLALAGRIASWVHANMRYCFDSTDVRTPAAQAFALGAGVCQDYAHVMLAICRAGGLPARYVSGHLVGEGGSHAWVEVLVEVGDGDRRRALAVAFDPTHGRRAETGYMTVAVGRDYADVAPTSGTFESSGRGRLSCRKRLEVVPPSTEPAVLASLS